MVHVHGSTIGSFLNRVVLHDSVNLTSLFSYSVGWQFTLFGSNSVGMSILQDGLCHAEQAEKLNAHRLRAKTSKSESEPGSVQNSLSRGTGRKSRDLATVHGSVCDDFFCFHRLVRFVVVGSDFLPDER